MCSPLQVLWLPVTGGRVLLSSSAGMTEKPSIILGAVATAQAKTAVFVKIVAEAADLGRPAHIGSRNRCFPGAGAKKNPSV
ncbi:hypothetical protein CBM2585_A40230 [Cupriavidus taiwanensis]|nr:hypothetical protein CBM2585_A40230 [Cupriavidus taiwanensis]